MYIPSTISSVLVLISSLNSIGEPVEHLLLQTIVSVGGVLVRTG